MNALHPPSSSDSDAAQSSLTASCSLYVCTSCRPKGSPRTSWKNRPGAQLFEELQERIGRSSLAEQVTVVPAECLSVCPRPCGIALASAGSWTYIFGDQVPGESAADIVACIERYLQSPDGFLARQARPESLRRSILGRVPPRQGGASCT